MVLVLKKLETAAFEFFRSNLCTNFALPKIRFVSSFVIRDPFPKQHLPTLDVASVVFVASTFSRMETPVPHQTGFGFRTGHPLDLLTIKPRKMVFPAINR